MAYKRIFLDCFLLVFILSSPLILAQGRGKGKGAAPGKPQQSAGAVSRGAGSSRQHGRNDEQMKYRGIDKNRDGVITRDEWPGNDQSFSRLDRNRDGVLSGDEVRPGLLGRNDKPSQEERRAMQQEKRFKSLDRNEDGVISQDEWRGKAKAFKKLDRNDDGVLTRDEFDRP